MQLNLKTNRWTSLWRRFVAGPHAPSFHKTASPKIPTDYAALAIPPDVRASAHNDGLAILHISTGQMFLCNRTGARIWQGITAGLSVDAISDEISRECGVGSHLVRRHAASFLGELARRGLLVEKVEC